MKKNVKKLFGSLLTLALLTGFYSCSNGSSNDLNDIENTQSSVTITYSESLLSALQTGNDVWGSGTNITGEAAPYTVTSGTGWDPNGMATMPFCTGSLEGFNYILVEIDTSSFTFRDGDAKYPSFEVKVEFPDGQGDYVIIDATKYGKDGLYTIPLTEVSDTSAIQQFTLNLRGNGKIKLQDVKKAKDN